MARDGWYEQQKRLHGGIGYIQRKYTKTKKRGRYSVKVEDLGNAIGEILAIYCSEVTKNAKKATDETAKETEERLRTTSPVQENPNPLTNKTNDSGRYARGWTAEIMFDNALEKRIAIYNATDWQLIHLLEWGHRRRGLHFTGGTVPPKPHFMPAYEFSQELYIKLVKEAIEGANKDT